MDPIFAALTPDDLSELAGLLNFSSTYEGGKFVNLDSMSDGERKLWLKHNYGLLENEICRLGSWTFGTTRPYSQVVRELAVKVGSSSSASASTAELETTLIQKIWTDAISKMSAEQQQELQVHVEQLASQYGKSVGAEIGGFAALGAAQLSGFGVYMLGSTLLGALNGALGLGLSFGAFTGLSSLISTVIGPIGWAALGLATIVKLGSPNYKKVLPAVIFVASKRAAMRVVEGHLSGEPRNIKRRYSAAEVAEYLSRPPVQLPACSGTSEETTNGGGEKPNHKAAKDDNCPSSQLLQHADSHKSAGSTPVSDIFVEKTAGSAVVELNTAVMHATEQEVQNARKSAKKAIQRKYIPSKLDKIVFSQKPENRLLMHAAAENTGQHFLDLSDNDQADVRRMVAERVEIERIALNSEKTDAHSNKSFKDAETSECEAGKAEIRRWEKHFSVVCPNVEFSQRALERWLSYGKSNLHDHFLREFVALNDGPLDAKHHVPKTSPKLFVKECGYDGRVYYRKCNSAGKVRVHLIGDQRTKTADYTLLQSH